ncbi:MAG: TrkA-related ion transporter [Thermodesulfobacteriota bacterium]
MDSIRKAAEKFIFACIIISCIIIPLDYLIPEYRSFWIGCEVFFAVIFTFEYLIRWYFSENKIKYPLTFFAVIDLLAILPSLLLLSNNFMLLRLFRIARFLRLLKLIRYNQYLYNSFNNIRNWFSGFRDEYQLDNLFNLFVLCILALVVGANLVYFTETEFASGTTPYTDYWKSYWHMVIVLISGIEDKEPASLLGKIEVTILLIAGVCVVGMITAEMVSILVRKFNRKGKAALKPVNLRMENHIVILGYNSHLDYIIRQIYTAFNGRYYILCVFKEADEFMVSVPHIYKKVLVLKGRPIHPDVLKYADITTARSIIALSEETDLVSDNKTLMKAIAVNSVNPDVPVTIQLQKPESIKYKNVIKNADFVVSSSYMEKLISQGILNPGVTEIYRSIMTFSSDSSEFYTIEISSQFNPETFNQAQKYFLENNESVIPVGVYRYCSDTKKYKCSINPLAFKNNCTDGDFVLNPGDFLMVIAYSMPLIDKKRKKRKFKLAKKTHKIARSYDLSCNSSFKDLRNNSVVICNANKNLKNIVNELINNSRNKKYEITIIIPDKEFWLENKNLHPDLEVDQYNVVYGDPGDPETLKNLNVHNFGAAVILADPRHGDLADAASTLVAMEIERLNPEIHTVMELINSVNREYIDFSIINEVVCLGDITEKLIAQSCYHPGSMDVFDELLSSEQGTPQVFLPKIPYFLKNKTYKDIYTLMVKHKKPFIPAGFVRDDEYFINPVFETSDDLPVLSGENDRLIVIAYELNPDDFNI